MNPDAPAPAAPTVPAAYRWLVLVVVSLAMFASYYLYDSIAPVADLLARDLGFTDADIGGLYSIYGIAAVIVLLAGGLIVDRFGTVASTVGFAALCSLAAVLMVTTDRQAVMMAARFVLGLGMEPLIVAITTALARWFRGRELGFALGLNLTVGRLGSVAADWSPTWAGFAYGTWRGPLLVAAGIGALCVAAALGYAALERLAARRYGLGRAGATDRLVWGDLLRFGRSYWWVAALCVAFYSAIFPFRTFAIKYFMEAWDLTRPAAGRANSVLPLAAMVATPLFGLLADKVGRRTWLLAAGAALLIPVYVLLATRLAPLGVPVALLAAAFSLVPAVMWPAVAFLVAERRLGTAYAIMSLVQQLGVAAVNWLVGRANDLAGAGPAHPAGYGPGLLVFAGLGVVALACALLLMREERGPGGHGLDRPTA